MAEALAAVGVASSIVQLIDFGSKVIRRLQEFHSKLDDVPPAFRHINSQLPLLLETLKGTEKAIGQGLIGTNVEKALTPVIDGCRSQIGQLDAVITKVLPAAGDSRLQRSKKALSSLYQDTKIDNISSALRNYVQILTFYHSAARSDLTALKGMPFYFVYVRPKLTFRR